MLMNHHLVGRGAEEDWPQAFEAIASRLGVFRYEGADHVLDIERVHITPFNLETAPVSRWSSIGWRRYYHPREWLKRLH